LAVPSKNTALYIIHSIYMKFYQKNNFALHHRWLLAKNLPKFQDNMKVF